MARVRHFVTVGLAYVHFVIGCANWTQASSITRNLEFGGMFSPSSLGKVLEFDYCSRRLGEQGPQKSRRVLLRSLRDLRETPVFISAFLARPELIRTLYRWEGYDFHCMGDRAFYNPLGKPCALYVAMYDPLTGERGEAITEAFEQTPEGIKELTAICSEIAKSEEFRSGQFSAALFAAN
jgi:hypothetical protein